jgi:hypothetical protein
MADYGKKENRECFLPPGVSDEEGSVKYGRNY